MSVRAIEDIPGEDRPAAFSGFDKYVCVAVQLF